MTEDENNEVDDTEPAEGQPVSAFDAEEVTSELAAKLASRSRHVCLFLGAGAGKAAGLPDLSGLQESIVDKLEGDDAKLVDGLLEKGNLEEALSLLRRIQSLLEEGETFRDFTGTDSSRCLQVVVAIAGARTRILRRSCCTNSPACIIPSF